MRKFYVVGLIVLAATIIGLAWAEQMTFSTYYPAPYGVYRQMVVSSRESIGDVNGDGEWNSGDMAVDGIGNPIEGSLTIANNVGIGTREPGRALHIAGTDGMRLEPSALPDPAATGDIAIDHTDNILKWHDGTDWQPLGGGRIADATMYDGSISLLEVYDGTFSPDPTVYIIDVTNHPAISNDTKVLLIHINLRSQNPQQANLGYKKPSDSNWKYLLGSPDHANQTEGDNIDECNVTHGRNVVNWFQLENGKIQFIIWSQGEPDLIIDAQGEIL